MELLKTIPPAHNGPTFMNFPLWLDVNTLEADFAILGIPYGFPYVSDGMPNDQANAPAAIRKESVRLSLGIDHWDFDLDGPLLNGREIRIFDCGDVPGDPANPERHYQVAEQIVRKIIENGARPIVLGGDHGVPIPVFKALADRAPVNIVHVDAHLDWRDEVNQVRLGYSSPMRRASEMQHVNNIIQIGLRAQGSARGQEVQDAHAYGAELITAYEVHEKGMAPFLEHIPKDESCYLTVDADGLDPSIMPAVAGPAPGGLLFHHVRELIHGMSHTNNFLGMDIVEITPAADINGISALTAGQLILNFIGACIRAELS